MDGLDARVLVKDISDARSLLLETSVEPIGTELKSVFGLGAMGVAGEVRYKDVKRGPI